MLVEQMQVKVFHFFYLVDIRANAKSATTFEKSRERIFVIKFFLFLKFSIICCFFFLIFIFQLLASYTFYINGGNIRFLIFNIALILSYIKIP